MIIPSSIANIIIGDRPNPDGDRHLVDMPRQNPVADREIKEGEHAELTISNLAQKILDQSGDDKDSHRLSIFA